MFQRALKQLSVKLSVEAEVSAVLEFVGWCVSCEKANKSNE